METDGRIPHSSFFIALALWLALVGPAAADSSFFILHSSFFIRPGAEAVEDEARAIARELQCPVCQGLSVADSPSELATQMRGVIRERLQAGESREAIVGYFVDRYGETILLTPPRSGFTAIAWIAPYGALLVGIGILLWATRRRSQPSGEEPPVDPGLAPYLDAVDRTFDHVQDEALR